MQNTVKTLTFVLVAVVLLALALITGPGSVEPPFFDDQGTEFFPEFQSWETAKALEVLEFDEKTAALDVFKVQLDNGRWTIPSHHGYPADAKDRMAKAAALLIGLRKDLIRSDLAEDHASFGVLDPRDQNTEAGSGQLIRFMDSAGNDLAALIVGEAESEDSQRRYVRLPGKDRTYVTELPAEVSTSFGEWIETDLLDLTAANMTGVVLDYYSVDERAGGIVPADRIEIDKKETDWTMMGLAEGESLDREVTDELVKTLDELQIVGVRKKPSGITAQLATDAGIRLDDLTIASLRQRGFYVTQDGRLLSNEGDLYAKTNEGVVYTLRFGEVIFGSGEELTAGSAAEGTPREDGSPAPEETGGASRFLMVTAHFDEKLLERPDTEALPRDHLDQRSQARRDIESIQRAIGTYREKNDRLPESMAQLTEGDSPALAELPKDPWGSDYAYVPSEDEYQIVSLGADQAEGGEGAGSDISSGAFDREDELREVARAHEERVQKVTAGEQAAKTLRVRFAPWYYVIDDEAYKKLHVGRDQLVIAKAADEPAKPDGPPVPGGNK